MVSVTPTTSVDPIGPGDPTDGWEEMSRTYEDVPSGGMKIRVGTPALGGDLYGTRTRIDNISLDCVPEPATVLLLGLGGLGLLRRKRC